MRTDVHCPSQINPADYEYVAQEYLRIDFDSAAFLLEERARIAAHMQRTGGTYSAHTHGGNCMVCGSVNAAYTVLFYHAKTNTYVRTGCDCAENIWHVDTSAFRRKMRDALEAQAGKRKAEKILEDAGLEDVINIWNTHRVQQIMFPPDYTEERTVCDIADRLIKYGSLSEKQMNFLKVLLDRISSRTTFEAKRNAQKAKREADHAAATDCPEGRIQIEGEVLTVREQESEIGYRTIFSYKVLVRADDGWKVWGTRPLDEIERGDRIRFTARVSRSDKDAKFGFYSRPTKAEIIRKGDTHARQSAEN